MEISSMGFETVPQLPPSEDEDPDTLNPQQGEAATTEAASQTGASNYKAVTSLFPGLEAILQALQPHGSGPASAHLDDQHTVVQAQQPQHSAPAFVRGGLSERYETGGRGAGTVSTGKGDVGGASYGSYQMSSRLGVVQDFLKHEGKQWADRFAGQTPGSAEFNATWKQIAKESPTAFQNAQHGYIERTHYSPLAAGVKARTGLDVNQHSHALQDAVWSTAVQHGARTHIIDAAVAKVDSQMSRNAPGYDEALIKAIYAERGKTDADGNLHYFRNNSSTVQHGVANRYQHELADALKMLKAERP